MIAPIIALLILPLLPLGDGAEPGPDSPSWQRLHAALAQLHAVEQGGGWPLIADGPPLHLGDVDARMPRLRRRLLGSEGTEDRFDAPLARAVREFQARHGLTVDGVVGPRTLEAMNVPVAVRRRQVEFSLGELARIPAAKARRQVWVNLLASRLTVVCEDSLLLAMRAIVGRPDRPTPSWSGQITMIEINPVWRIPQKLARRDILPAVRRDPRYLIERGIQVFESWQPGAAELDPLAIDWSAIKSWDLAFKLQQVPGPTNPLGRAKFVFSNPYAVYIHDTPHRRAFARADRFESSGCVRIQDPAALIATLDPELGLELDQALNTGRTLRRPLDEPVPVHLVYLTAWVDRQGRLHFRDDLYRRDPVLAAWSSPPDQAPPWASPVADRAGVEVNETRTGIVADASDSFP